MDPISETEWLTRFHARLIVRGLEPDTAVGIDPEIDMGYTPEDAADDEIAAWLRIATSTSPTFTTHPS